MYWPRVGHLREAGTLETGEQETSALERAVSILRERGPMRAGRLGCELWRPPGMESKEEIRDNQFCRSAVKLLARAQELGLVNWRPCGERSREWFAHPAR